MTKLERLRTKYAKVDREFNARIMRLTLLNTGPYNGDAVYCQLFARERLIKQRIRYQEAIYAQVNGL
jgi:hypothetical protein